jgi:hypothetical protein
MKKRLSCLFLVLVLCLTLPVTAFASENGSNENFEFIPMTMEEYVSNKAESLGISYDEADQLVVKSINDTLSEIFPLTRGGSFVGSSSEEVNGTRFTTGYIQYTETVANTNGKIKIKISVPALMIETSVGRYLSDVSTDQARIYEASSGTYTIAQHTTQLTINFKDKFTVVMSGAGNVEITYGNAVEIGIDMEFFGYSENTSYNTYTRIPFVIGTTYKVPNR